MPLPPIGWPFSPDHFGPLVNAVKASGAGFVAARRSTLR